jgi:hypothetical protein
MHFLRKFRFLKITGKPCVPETLEASRRGAAVLKVGPLVRYRTEDIEGWIAELPTGGNGRRFTVRSAMRSKLAISA